MNRRINFQQTQLLESEKFSNLAKDNSAKNFINTGLGDHISIQFVLRFSISHTNMKIQYYINVISLIADSYIG
jgi:hypothetical protein